MSQRQLFTAHPDPETDSHDSDLQSIDEFVTSQYGVSERPYSDAPSAHSRFTEEFRDQEGEALTAVTYDERLNQYSKQGIAEDILNMSPAEYVTLIHSSDHNWGANGWVYFEEDGKVRNETYFGEEDREGRDVKREIREEFGISTNIPFF